MFRLLKFPRKSRFFFSFSQNIKDRIRRERSERLKLDATAALATRSSDDIKKIRNIGIIAHIDAGKTTTTERMLFYSGALSEPGEVHEGNTVMDYMEQERERGITIRAAAISFHWEGYHINLIDTPGHIDFTGEVERSLKVLDGAVAIFDAVAGVQAQSEMVWLQANKFKVPRIAFVNKMDRPGASLEFTLQTIKNKLNVTPLVLQVPVGDSERFSSVIDILKMELISWSDKLGCIVEKSQITETHRLYKDAFAAKEKLIENISMFDDVIAEKFLNGEHITEETIKKAIKTILVKNPNKTCAVLLGSALKNKGIQPLISGIIDYLPNPEEKEPKASTLNANLVRLPSKTEKLLAYAYKIVNDKQKGVLTYLRIYSGRLHNRTQLYNASRNLPEKLNQIYRVRANDYVSLPEVTAGDIAAVAGIKFTQSGDTLIENNDERFLLEEIQMPQPVFFAALEYEYAREKAKLQAALNDISKEDSSLIIKEDAESGQLLVSGLGELHLEILRDRLLLDYGLKTTLSKFRISYRETIGNTARRSLELQKVHAGRPVFAYLDFEILPNESESKNESKPEAGTNTVELAFERNRRFDDYYAEFKKRKAEIKRKKRKGSLWDDLPDEEVASPPSGPAGNAVSTKMVFNPNTPEEIETFEDDYGEDTIYGVESIPYEILYSVENTIQNSFLRGDLIGSPLMNVKVKIIELRYSIRRSNPMIFQMAAVDLMKDLIKSAESQILEPVMDFEISVPNNAVQSILNDVIKMRRGRVGEIVKEGGRFNQDEDARSLVYAVMPLESSIGYATFLRTLTKGEGSFIMKFKKYEYVGPLRQKELIESPP